MSNNLSVVTRIGAGVRLTDEAVAAIVANLPEGFDPKERGAVTEAVHLWAVGAEGKRPAVKVGPAGAQKATDYGRGVDTLTKAVKRALAAQDDSPKAVTMRVTLSGEGGGSAVVPADHPLYAALVALIAGEAADEAADEAPALAIAS